MKLRNLKNGRRIWTHDDNDFIASEIERANDYFESDILHKILPMIVNSKNIVEIGANIGNHILFYDEYIHPDHVIAFEPLPQNIDILKKNIKEFVKFGVTLNEFGLAQKNETATFHVNPNNYGGSSIFGSLNNNVEAEVKLKNVSEVFDGIRESVDFIKCDIEGGEKYILNEIFDFASINKSLLWIELTPQNYGVEYFKLIKELCDKYDLIFNHEYDFVFNFSNIKGVKSDKTYILGYIYMLQKMYMKASNSQEVSDIKTSYKEIGWRNVKFMDKLFWFKIKKHMTFKKYR